MTEEEIKQEIVTCETDINRHYKGLVDAARNVGAAGLSEIESYGRIGASKAAADEKKVILVSLIFCVFGIALLFISVFFGICLILLGIVAAYYLSRDARRKSDSIANDQNALLGGEKRTKAVLDDWLDHHKFI